MRTSSFDDMILDNDRSLTPNEAIKPVTKQEKGALHIIFKILTKKFLIIGITISSLYFVITGI